MIFSRVIMILLFAVVTVSFAEAEIKPPVRPAPKDRCQVCGMFVAKYPNWTAEIVFHDGTYVMFDGAKDLFTYLFDIRKYSPTKKPSDMDQASIYVADYYSVALIDGRAAYYVLGSDVRGPMGSELVPFATLSDAREFKKDHKGKSVLTFKDITPEILNSLK
jgi:nitrous oxide reductase accessory protein NosL